MTTRLVLLVCCSLLLLSATTAQRDNFSVKAHLPHTDKTVNGTRVIQQLIDSCHATGGGTVFFAAGDYLTGSLELKENVFLELAAGATLYGSTKITDYPEEKKASLIYANGANNIGIRGPGTINGQGDNFWRGQEHPITRPDRLILIENGKNVRFSDLTILNSPNWNLEVRFCDGVWIEGITMHAERKAPNTDGIDPVSSSNVFISNCYIDVGDDAICPKSRAGIPVENLVVENCVLISDDAAIKLGTRSEDPIRNCLFSNIIIRNSDYGIAFFNKDGGTFENIRFDNIHIETTDDAAADWTKPPGTYPIFVDLEHRPSSKRAGRPLGKIKNVFFSNITIDAPQGRCLFLGQPDAPLENIQLHDIDFTLHERKSFAGSKKPRGLRSLTDKAANDFSDVPAHFSFAYVDGLVVDGLDIHDLSTGSANERRMIWGKEVSGLRLQNLRERLVTPNEKLPLVHFEASQDLEITNCSPRTNTVPFLELEGDRTSSVTLRNNDFRKGGKTFTTTDGATTSAVLSTQNIK